VVDKKQSSRVTTHEPRYTITIMNELSDDGELLLPAASEGSKKRTSTSSETSASKKVKITEKPINYRLRNLKLVPLNHLKSEVWTVVVNFHT
jgi:hypothetical protein